MLSTVVISGCFNVVKSCAGSTLVKLQVARAVNVSNICRVITPVYGASYSENSIFWYTMLMRGVISIYGWYNLSLTRIKQL